jgi:hypothetical protein
VPHDTHLLADDAWEPTVRVRRVFLSVQ